RLDEALAEMPEVGRPALLRELLRLDLAYRRKGGERPSPAEYRARFPGQEAEVEAAFGSVPADADRGQGHPTAPPGPARRLLGAWVQDRLAREGGDAGSSLAVRGRGGPARAELERWMADEPVTAWREPISRRARRWARRDRLVVAAAAAAVAAGMV